MLLNIFQYDFIIRGLIAGLIVGVIAPLIGVFLVLRRYSLIADTLSHVSLAGIALGLIFGWNPAFAALGTTVIAALGLEKLRVSRRIYNESALAIYLSGSLALAVVLLSLAHGFNSNLFSYLFGSIVTVTSHDIYVMAILALIVIVTLAAFFKEIVFITFDEEAAKVSGLPVRLVNTIFIVLAALTVSLSIPIIGVLLIAALIVIPPVTALQLRRSLLPTIVYAEIFSLFSVSAGLLLSFYFNLATGGTIVLVMLLIFSLIFITRPRA
jgi:zinc transport system permease protein